MKTRNELIQQAHETINTIDEKIRTAETRLRSKKAEAARDARGELRDLKDSRDSFRLKLRSAKRETAAGWEHMREDFSNSAETLKVTAARVFRKLSA